MRGSAAGWPATRSGGEMVSWIMPSLHRINEDQLEQRRITATPKKSEYDKHYRILHPEVNKAAIQRYYKAHREAINVMKARANKRYRERYPERVKEALNRSLVY